jgi:hypothetical protein
MFEYETIKSDEDMMGLATEWHRMRRKRIQEKTVKHMQHIKQDLQSGELQSQKEAACQLWEFSRNEDMLRIIDSGAADEGTAVDDIEWTLPKNTAVKVRVGGQWHDGVIINENIRDGTYNLEYGSDEKEAKSVKSIDIRHFRQLKTLPKMWQVLSETMLIRDSSNESLALATVCIAIFWNLWVHKNVNYKAKLIDHNMDVELLKVLEHSEVLSRCKQQTRHGGEHVGRLGVGEGVYEEEGDEENEGGEEDEGEGGDGVAGDEGGEGGQLSLSKGGDATCVDVGSLTKEEMLSPAVQEFLNTTLGLLEVMSDGPYCRLLISSGMISVLLHLIEFKLSAARILHNCIVKLETELGSDEERAATIIECYEQHGGVLQGAFFDATSPATDKATDKNAADTNKGRAEGAVTARMSKDHQYYAMFIFSWLGQRVPMAAHVGAGMDSSTLTKNILSVALDVARDALAPGKKRDRDSRDILRYCTLCLWEIAEDDVDAALMESARMMEDKHISRQREAEEKKNRHSTHSTRQRAWTVEEYVMMIELAMLCTGTLPEYTSQWWDSNYDLALFCAAALANMTFNAAHSAELLEIVEGKKPQLPEQGASDVAPVAAAVPAQPTRPTPKLSKKGQRKKGRLPRGIVEKRDRKSGHKYYWDKKTGQISWTKPESVEEQEKVQAAAAEGGGAEDADADTPSPKHGLRKERWANLVGEYDQNDETTDNPLILEAAAAMMNCPVPIFRLCASSIVLGLSLKKGSRHIVNRHRVYSVIKNVSLTRKVSAKLDESGRKVSVSESKVSEKTHEACSCIIMLLADDYDDEEEEDLADAVTLVATAPFSAWQYALSTAWLLAREESNRERMAAKQIVNIVLQRCENFPLRHHLDYVTLEWVLGLLWIFAHTVTGQEQLLQKRSLAFLLNCCKLPLRFTTAIELGLSVVWTILALGHGRRSSYARWEGKKLLLDCELLPLLLISMNDPGCNSTVSTRRLRLLSIQFYQVFAFSKDLSTNAHNIGLADEKRFVRPLLEILAVNSPYTNEQQSYAADVLVVLSTNQKHFKAMMESGAIGVLLKLAVKRMKELLEKGWEQGDGKPPTLAQTASFAAKDETDSLTTTLHTLLNLSTVPEAQLKIGMSRELKSLVRFARTSKECDAQRFCFGILQNLKLHTKNRSRLYRFELKYKAVQSCKEEMELMWQSKKGAPSVRGLTQTMVESWTDGGFEGEEDEDDEEWDALDDEDDDAEEVDEEGHSPDKWESGDDGDELGGLPPTTPAGRIQESSLNHVHVPTPPMTYPRKYMHHSQRKIRTPMGASTALSASSATSSPKRGKAAPTGGTRRQRPLTEPKATSPSGHGALGKKGGRPESHFHYPLHMLDANLRSPISDTWGGSRRQKAEVMSPMHLDGAHFSGLRVGATQHHYRYRHYHKQEAPTSPRYNEVHNAHREETQKEMRAALSAGSNNQGGDMTKAAHRNSQQVIKAVVKRIQEAIQDNKTGHIRFVEDPECTKKAEMNLDRNEATGKSVHSLANRIGNRVWHPDLVQLQEDNSGFKMTLGLMELAGARHHFKFNSDSRIGPPSAATGVVAAAMEQSAHTDEDKHGMGGDPDYGGEDDGGVDDQLNHTGPAGTQDLHSTAHIFGNTKSSGTSKPSTSEFSDEYYGGVQPRTEVAKFPHVDGCQYCLGIYGHYKTKDGTMLHICVKPGMAEAPSIPLNTEMPPVPNSLQLLRQESLPPSPYPPTFHDTTFRYGSPAKPDLAPWPCVHSLPVFDHECDWLTCTHFGRVADTSWLELVCEEFMEAPPEIILEEEKELPRWDLYKDSKVWPPRQKHSEARDFFDNKKSEKKTFKTDMEHLFKDDRFNNALEKWHKNDPVASGADMSKLAEALQEKLQVYHSMLNAVYRYYSNGGLDWFTFQPPDWTELTLNMGMPGHDERLNTAAMGSLLIQGQKIGDIGEKMKTVNSLLRYKWLHIMISFASEKFINVESATKSVVEAVQMLMDNHMIPTFTKLAQQTGALAAPNGKAEEDSADTEAEAANQGEGTGGKGNAGPFDHNEYRRERLYCKEVDDLLHEHFNILSKIYQRYAPASLAKGSKPKEDGPMITEEWNGLLHDMNWTDENFTNKQQSLTFVWSQMAVTDETKTQKAHTITLTDFLEALCRVADTRWLPNLSLLDESGCVNSIEFMYSRAAENDPTTNQPWGARMRLPEYAAPAMHGPFKYPFKFGYEERSGVPEDQSLTWRLQQTLGLMYTDLQKGGLTGHQLEVLDGGVLRKWNAMLQGGLTKLGRAGAASDSEEADHARTPTPTGS